jgi:DNA-binding NtrC family response regulator
MKILIVEDEKITRITLADLLVREGHEVDTASNGEAGVQQVMQNSYDVIVTDLRLPRKDGIEVLKTAKEQNPDCEVIVITAYASIDTAITALKLGAYDYVTKPLTPEKFLILIRNINEFHVVKHENIELKKRLDQIENNSLIGTSHPMRKLMETIRNVAPHDYTVLIQGESGTGKEMVAKSLHKFSNRSTRPFIAINCAAIPETLLESELFGHEKGAFSGAIQQHSGYFERADGGTIFIDDVDDFPLHLQVKLLRVLQERQIVRVGGSETLTIDVRVICATKVSLEEMVQNKTFREDLFYRLHIIPLHLPPLRDRKDDIPSLVNHFFKKLKAEDVLDKADANFYDNLMRYDWPGNVRQLENTIERILATGDFSIPAGLTSAVPLAHTPSSAVANPVAANGFTYPPFEEYIQKKEEEILLWALNKSGNNISKAAELLAIPRGTLRSKLKKLELDPE